MARWQSWPLADVTNVRAKERNGLGTLDLLGTDSRPAIGGIPTVAPARRTSLCAASTRCDAACRRN